MIAEPTELSFEADGLTYRGLAWGDSVNPMVFVIHGWLDNALSFSILAPLLSNFYVVALDLSGHGFSSHRSADANYHIWDDIPQLAAIIDQLDVQQVHVVGHSRGAAVAGVLAVALGDRCASLCMLDGMISRSFENDNGAELFRNSLSERRRYLSKPPRIFSSVEEFIQARSRYGFTRDNAKVLAPRALRQLDEGWLLLSDPKLLGNSTIKLSEETSNSFYRSMVCPVAVITGEAGFFASSESQERIKGIGLLTPRFSQLTIRGPHHFHMEGDVQALSAILENFFQTGQLPSDAATTVS